MEEASEEVPVEEVVEDSRAFGWQQDVTAYCEGGMP